MPLFGSRQAFPYHVDDPVRSAVAQPRGSRNRLKRPAMRSAAGPAGIPDLEVGEDVKAGC